ncbi:helix-turn-helix domain-containing protein [Streptomyces sp. SID5914]|nr:helix-turn-helix transcriptional regulator [Streptomyces sp. SID5914]MZG13469.1 helix-turn-helix domain-containing protein [Streptomyces sp. SID5914]
MMLRSELVSATPSSGLRPYVNGYLGFRESGASVRRRLMPFSTVAVILSFDQHLLVADTEQQLTHHASLVRGLSSGPGISLHGGYAHGLLLELTPLGATLLLGVPGAELRDRIVPLEALLGREAHVLVARLLGQPAWPQRFALLDAWLSGRIDVAPPLAPGVVRAWRRLTASGGRVPVGDLLEELGGSRRLAQRFGEIVGMTPKTYARVIRFEHAMTRLSGGDDEFGIIALSCGYYDQAHFNRDVRAFTGVSPTALLAERLGGGAGFGCLEAASVPNGAI